MISPTHEFWVRTIATIGIESAAVIGLIFLAQFRVRSSAWRRTLWQVGALALLVLLTVELSGFGHGVAAMVWGRSEARKRVAIKVSHEAKSVPMTPDLSTQEAGVMTSPITDAPVWWPGIVWSGGVALVLARMAFAHVLFALLRRRQAGRGDAALMERARELGGKLGIADSVRVIEAAQLASPVVFGLLNPCIAVPKNFASDFSHTEQDAMLAHELAHLAGRDPFWYLLTDLLAACLWWNPLVWWARRRFQAASELAADEATTLLANGPESLAECLVRLGRNITTSPSWAWTGVRGGFRSSLGQRVERLLSLGGQQPTQHRPILLARSAMTLGLVGMIVLSSGWLQGQGLHKETSWQATLKQSWQNSAGGVVLMAALMPASELADPAATPAVPTHSQPHDAAHATNEPAKLFSRTFKVDPPTFERAVIEALEPESTNQEAASAMTTNLIGYHQAIRLLLAKAGVNLTLPGKSVFYNSTTGALLVRADLSELEHIEQLVELLNQAPPQVVVEATVMAVSKTTALQVDPSLASPTFAGAAPGTTNSLGSVTGILTAGQYRIMYRTLTNQPGTQVLAAPKVVTLSGRQALISIEQPASAGNNLLSLSLNVQPKVRADEHSIEIMIKPTVTEQLDTGVRTNTFQSRAQVWDGQTLVLGQMAWTGATGASEGLLVFITPTIVDAAGNRVHTGAESSLPPGR